MLHAVLTISRVHENGVRLYAAQRSQKHVNSPVGDREDFVLEHYTRSIGHLRPCLSIRDRSSARLTLVTCVIFVCLELLRGHFKTAIFHLESGIKVLHEAQCQSSAAVDDWIIDVFSRLYIQAALLNQHRRYPLVYTTYDFQQHRRDEQFLNFNQAWQQLECILFRIIELSADIRHDEPLACLSVDSNVLFSLRQEQIQVDLNHWLGTYERSRASLQSLLRNDIELFAFRLLCSHHTVAQIMAATCFRDLDDETMFDKYDHQFIIAINHSIALANVRESQLSSAVTSMRCFNMTRSVIDIGWISPLYFVALKCRAHRIRLQAIRLLESSSHREGFLDASILVCVARKVMEIEEGDFYAHIDTNDNFGLLEPPTLEDLLLVPLLPEYRRVYDVDVTLPDGPMDSILLTCRQKELHGKCREIVTEYNMQQQRWIERSEDSILYKTSR